MVFPGALGDLICLIPALRILSRRYRDCDLELMARAELADFAIGRIGISRGHSMDRREMSLLFSPAVDAVVEAGGFFHAFSCVHSFFGYDDQRFRRSLPQAAGGPVFFHRFRPEAEGHVSAAYVKGLGEPLPEKGLGPELTGIELAADDVAQALRIIASCGTEPGRYLLLMPGCGSRTKNWPAENYLQLARHLGKSMRVMAVLGPAEEYIEAAFSGLSPIKNPPLGALAALARLSEVFVGNDSGVSHLAAAAGGRGVVIFGPSDPMRWRPLGRVTVLRRMPLEDLRWDEVAQALMEMRRRAESTH